MSMVLVYDFAFGNLARGLGNKYEYEIETSYDETLTEELNGKCELSFKIPKGDPALEFVAVERLIYFTEGKLHDKNYLFIIYELQKSQSYVTVRARQYVSYAIYWLVKPFTATSFSDAITKIMSGTYDWQNDFGTEAITLTNVDVTDNRAFTFSKPMNVWTLIGDLIKFYGVDIVYNWAEIRFYARAGEDIVQQIETGINMTEFDLKANDADMYNYVYPYWQKSGSGTVYGHPEPTYVFTYESVRALAVDFSSQFDEAPNTSDLSTAARQYISENNLGAHVYTLKTNFAAEQGTQLDDLSLGDRVTVVNSDYGYSETVRVVSIKWNVRTNRATEVQLGKIDNTASRIMAAQSANLQELDNNKFTAPAVILAKTTSQSVTEYNMEPGFIPDNFHSFMLVLKNSVRTMASTTIQRQDIPNTTTSDYADDNNFIAESHVTSFANVIGAVKFDIENWKCKMLVNTAGYEAVLYGLR